MKYLLIILLLIVGCKQDGSDGANGKSVVGPQGVAGPAGAQGLQGPAGRDSNLSFFRSDDIEECESGSGLVVMNTENDLEVSYVCDGSNGLNGEDGEDGDDGTIVYCKIYWKHGKKRCKWIRL